MKQNEGSQSAIPIANPDQEAWVKKTIEHAIRMALALEREVKTGGDRFVMDYAINGIAEGSAIEVIRDMRHQPGYVNLKNLWPADTGDSKK